MTASGPVGAAFVDCHLRHRRLYPADVYEELRALTVIDAIEEFVPPEPATAECTRHDWVPIEEQPDLAMLLCRRCLAVSVVAVKP